MYKIAKLEPRPSVAKARRRRITRDKVILFPGQRQTGMIRKLISDIADQSDRDAEAFLVRHFEVEEARLTEYGIGAPDIDRYISETARAVWARLRTIREGVA